MKTLQTPEEYGYVQHGNIVLFQKGPLSQWYGGFKDQTGGFLNGGHLSGYYFNCCEQWMMWQKAHVFGDSEIADKILRETNPGTQKDLGRQVKNFQPKSWDSIKEEVVFVGNYLKFTQNEHLKDFMLKYPIDTIFAEAAPWDPIWGIGLGPEDPDAADPSKWRGQNLLGKAISRVRKLL